MHGTFGMVRTTYIAAAASGAAARAKNKADSVAHQVKALEANLAKTLLICETLWEFISKEQGLNETDLNKMMYDIDMRDGQLDGKNQRKISECPDCARKVSPRHPACLYCGKVIDSSAFSM
ncbi:MAG: hypothetical protein KAJ07_11855 [Planctomycetes bacterium]|nr:hypothetical protein [Planctomycetota bacterium]